MASYWMDAATLLLQSQRVIALRCAKIAWGGESAREEAYQMVCEKMKASSDATRMLMAGGTQGMVLAHYNALVSDNVKRLSSPR